MPTKASSLADFGSGIGTDGSILKVDQTNRRIGIGTSNPQETLSVLGDARISGVLTTTNLTTTNINVTGVSTLGSFSTATNINVTGVSTLGSLKISSGIVTATSGVVTYYGDGSNLTGVAAAGAGGANDITSSLFF